MYSEVGLGLLFLAAFIWLCILTYLNISNRSFLQRLFPSSGERDIRRKFEAVLIAINQFKNRLNGLDEKIAVIHQEGRKHIQRIALLRYNPYDDTGGDMSFSMAILNGGGDGVIVTSLHSRSGTRVYAKDVAGGKGVRHEFSKEEEAVVRKAME